MITLYTYKRQAPMLLFARETEEAQLADFGVRVLRYE